MSSQVFLSIGSNLGDGLTNCKRAIELIAVDPAKAKLLKKSSFYRTTAWGKTDQPAFINCAVEIDSPLTPHKLLRFLKAIEKKMGRTGGERWGPRVIDIDIIFMGDRVVSGPCLTIPHPHARERRFVLVPMAEIAPDFVHPVLRKKASEILSELKDKGEARRVEHEESLACKGVDPLTG
jgi:2-amino-4-hydroxy-6-hydroxymethyldihydropteridine diphosphokinase